VTLSNGELGDRLPDDAFKVSESSGFCANRSKELKNGRLSGVGISNTGARDEQQNGTQPERIVGDAKVVFYQIFGWPGGRDVYFVFLEATDRELLGTFLWIHTRDILENSVENIAIDIVGIRLWVDVS
jgi:hypothetical protein